MKMYKAIMAKRYKRKQESVAAAAARRAASDSSSNSNDSDDEPDPPTKDETKKSAESSKRSRPLRKPSRKLQEGKRNDDDFDSMKSYTRNATAPAKLTPGNVLMSRKVSKVSKPFDLEESEPDLLSSPGQPDSSPDTLDDANDASSVSASNASPASASNASLASASKASPASTSNASPASASNASPAFANGASPTATTTPNLLSLSPILRNQCWICAVQLKFPSPNMVCWYATHPHPYLPGVPVCSVCSSTVKQESDVCAGCFNTNDATTTTLVLCDSCPNEFCTDCLKHFYNVEQLMQQDEEWHCPQCRPVLEPLVIEEQEELDELLDRLYYAELEHERCEQDDSHEQRVADCISVTLDAIWNQHAISSEQIYKHLLPDLYGWSSAKEAISDEVLAKVNQVLDYRRMQQSREETPEEDGEDIDMDECFDDVEDLGAFESEEESHLSQVARKKGGWAGRCRPRAREIDMALANESKLNICVKTTFKEKDDKERVEYGDDDEEDVVVLVKPKQKRRMSTEQSKRSRPSNGQKSLGSTPKRQRVAPTSISAVTKVLKPSKGFSSQLPSSKVIPATPKPITKDLKASDCVLCDTKVRRVLIDPTIAKHLKPHQLEAAQFMWNNCFADFETKVDGDNFEVQNSNSTSRIDSTGGSVGLVEAPTVGGCVLAHSMGLGKSLSSISLIHTVMTHPTMKGANGEGLIARVLLVAPVNTIANWENEFNIWQQEVECRLTVHNLSKPNATVRHSHVESWMKGGGVLLVSDNIFKSLWNNCEVQPDLIVLDEAHTMLKNLQTNIYKALQSIRTPRRIALTGTPFQNNLIEYYYLINYIRPSILNVANERQFEEQYVIPINAGSTKDAQMNDVAKSLQTARRLSEKIKPYLHRKDSSTLLDHLPPMQYNVLHVYPTRLQSKLYGLYKKRQTTNNFFAQFKALNGIHTHPGALTVPSDGGKQNNDNEAWWQPRLDEEGEEGFRKVDNGNKIVVLLHIIAYSLQVGDKVLVFSNTLSNLNYIEHVLALPKWEEHVPSLASQFPGKTFGGWLKGQDFDRITSSMDASERGDLVCQFADKSRDVKVFLISKAGGIGINLIPANRVVLMDTHFNPTIASQAIHRTYRYGQEKPVYCYQLLTHGTLEEKVYSRCVNKTGLSYLVIDDKAIKRNFNEQQLENLMQTLCWVQCEKCEKWRCLGDSSVGDDLPDEWYCSMNPDVQNNTCEDREKDQAWYEKKFSGMAMEKQKLENPIVSGPKRVADPLMDQLWDLKMSKKNTCILAKHYLHDNMLKTTSCTDALEEAWQDLQSQQEELLKRQNPKSQAGAEDVVSVLKNQRQDSQPNIAKPQHKAVTAPVPKHPPESQPSQRPVGSDVVSSKSQHRAFSSLPREVPRGKTAVPPTIQQPAKMMPDERDSAVVESPDRAGVEDVVSVLKNQRQDSQPNIAKPQHKAVTALVPKHPPESQPSQRPVGSDVVSSKSQPRALSSLPREVPRGKTAVPPTIQQPAKMMPDERDSAVVESPDLVSKPHAAASQKSELQCPPHQTNSSRRKSLAQELGCIQSNIKQEQSHNARMSWLSQSLTFSATTRTAVTPVDQQQTVIDLSNDE